MKKIPLTKGYIALVDDSFFEKISSHKWFFQSGYAARSLCRKGVRSNWKMHWSVIGKPEVGMVVDHINGNGLDNRLENLRFCTSSQNTKNQVKHCRNTSGYKGVVKYSGKKSDRWTARISVNNKIFRLGRFNSPKDAAKAYNEAAIKYHGEFANINSI